MPLVPVWLIANRLIAGGFSAYGQAELARRIRCDSRHLAEAQGLREYFDPPDGSGLGGADFSWSGAVWL